MKRLLTVGHSYVVAANRQLAHQMALEGRGEWQVTALAPSRVTGDLRRIDVEPIAGEACALETAPVRMDRIPHLMWYGGGARDILARDWDVVHCWEEPYTLPAVQVARRIPRRTRLAVASFQNIGKRYPWPIAAFERTTMKRADGWIAFGTTVQHALRDRPGYDLPCRVIPPGVDVVRFRPDASARQRVLDSVSWPADALVVGYLGRFIEAKGLQILMDALNASAAEWRALFVGGGPFEPALRRFAAAHPGRVHVQTGVPHDEVPGWLNAMTILCAPSRTTAAWREQFGRMLIEAMACGVPIVASDSGEMPFVVGDAGVIVAEADVRAWTAAIERLLGDAALRRTCAGRGLARAAADFRWTDVARRHLDFFEALLRHEATA
jgi:glycosyltransferase involved in cell wall biosynthesis